MMKIVALHNLLLALTGTGEIIKGGVRWVALLENVLLIWNKLISNIRYYFQTVPISPALKN